MIQNLMTGGLSIEDTLTLWAASLRDAKQRIRPLFTQDRVATSAELFLDALLGTEPRKTGWMRAEAAGDVGPWKGYRCVGAETIAERRIKFGLALILFEIAQKLSIICLCTR